MQREPENLTLQERLFYVGILNSFPLDFIIRKLIINHVSQTFLNQLPIPSHNIFPYSEEIIQITKQLLLLDDERYSVLQELPGDASRFIL